MTRQRQVVLEAVRATDAHPTGDEVYRLARRKLPHISLGTVYRNLELLSEAGLIRKLELGGAARRFDAPRLRPPARALFGVRQGRGSS